MSQLSIAVRLKPGSSAGGEVLQSPGPLKVDTTHKYAELTDLCDKFPKTFSYTFDEIFDNKASNENVFDSLVQPSVQDALDGQGGNFLCYGPSKSGKTHTFEGVINLAVAGILNKNSEETTEIGMSCIDMSAGNIYDMLRPSDLLPSTRRKEPVKKLRPKKSGYAGIFVEEATILQINSVDSFQKALKRANKRRRNTHSALKVTLDKSHLILQLRVRSGHREGHLTFVDLASSTSANSWADSFNKHSIESRLANKAILALFNVLKALAQKKKKHIPFRDSKLTALLKENLNCSGKTSLLGCASPGEDTYQNIETTLQYLYCIKAMPIHVPKDLKFFDDSGQPCNSSTAILAPGSASILEVSNKRSPLRPVHVNLSETEALNEQDAILTKEEAKNNGLPQLSQTDGLQLPEESEEGVGNHDVEARLENMIGRPLSDCSSSQSLSGDMEKMLVELVNKTSGSTFLQTSKPQQFEEMEAMVSTMTASNQSLQALCRSYLQTIDELNMSKGLASSPRSSPMCSPKAPSELSTQRALFPATPISAKVPTISLTLPSPNTVGVTQMFRPLPSPAPMVPMQSPIKKEKPTSADYRSAIQDLRNENVRLAKKQEIGEETAFEDLEQLVSKEAKLLHQNEMLKEALAASDMKKKEFSVQLEKLKESHQNQLKEHAIQEINAVQPVSRLEELLATRLKRVDAEWKRLQEDRTDLERSVQQRATSNERLTRQVASLNEELLEKGREKLEWMKQKSQLEAAFHELTGQTAAQSEHLVFRERAQSSSDKSLDLLQRKLRQANQENESLLSELKDRRSDISALAAEKAQFCSRTMEAEDRVIQLNGALEICERDAVEQEKKLASTLELLAAVEQGAESKGNQLELAQAMEREQEKMLITSEEGREVAQMESERLVGQIHSLQDKLQAMENQCLQTQESKSALAKLSEQLREELEESRYKVKSQAAAAAEAEDLARGLSQQLETAQMALDAEKSRCDSLERARVEAQNSLEQATLDVCELQAKFAASAGKLEVEQVGSEQLYKELQAARSELDNFRTAQARLGEDTERAQTCLAGEVHKNKQLEQLLSDLQRQMGEQTEKLDELKADLRARDNEKLGWVQVKRDLRAQLAHQTVQLSETELSQAGLRRKLQNAEQQREELQEERKSLQAALKGLNQDQKQKNAAHLELELELAKQEERIQKLASERNIINQNLEKFASTNSELAQMLETSRLETSILKKSAAEEAGTLASCRDQISALKQEAQAACAATAELAQQLKDAQKACSSAKEEVEQRLQEELCKEEDKAAGLEAKIESMATALKELQYAHDQGMQQAENLKRADEQARQEAQQREEVLRGEQQATMTQCKVYKREVDDLSDELVSAQSRAADLAEKLQTSLRENEFVAVELDSAREDILALEAQITDAQKELVRLAGAEAESERLANELAQLQQTQREVVDQVAAGEDELMQLQTAKQKHEFRTKELEEQVGRLQEQLEEQETKLAGCREEARCLEGEVANAEAATHKAEASRRAAELEAFRQTEEIARLREQLREAAACAKDEDDSREALKDQLTQLGELLERAQHSLAATNQECMLERQLAAEACLKEKQAEERRDQEKEKRKQADKRVKLLEEELEGCRSQIEHATAGEIKTAEQLSSQQNQLEWEKERVDKLAAKLEVAAERVEQEQSRAETAKLELMEAHVAAKEGQEKIQALQSEVLELAERKRIEIEQGRALAAALAVREARIEELEMLSGDLEGQFVASSQCLEETTQLKMQALQRVSQLEIELQQRGTTLQDEVETLTATKEALLGRAEQREATLDKLEAAQEASEREAAALQAELRTAEAAKLESEEGKQRFESLLAAKEEALQSYADSMQSFKQLYQERDEQCVELSEQVAAQKAQLAKVIKQLEAARGTADQGAREADHMIEEARELKEQLAMAEAARIKLAAQLETAKVEQARYETGAAGRETQLRQRVQDVERQLTECSAQLEQFRAANPALQEAAAKTSELGLKLQQRDAELLKLRQMLSQEQAERRELLGEKEVMVAMAERQAQLESQLVEARELLAEYEKDAVARTERWEELRQEAQQESNTQLTALEEQVTALKLARQQAEQELETRGKELNFALKAKAQLSTSLALLRGEKARTEGEPNKSEKAEKKPFCTAECDRCQALKLTNRDLNTKLSVKVVEVNRLTASRLTLLETMTSKDATIKCMAMPQASNVQLKALQEQCHSLHLSESRLVTRLVAQEQAIDALRQAGASKQTSGVSDSTTLPAGAARKEDAQQIAARQVCLSQMLELREKECTRLQQLAGGLEKALAESQRRAKEEARRASHALVHGEWTEAKEEELQALQQQVKHQKQDIHVLRSKLAEAEGRKRESEQQLKALHRAHDDFRIKSEEDQKTLKHQLKGSQETIQRLNSMQAVSNDDEQRRLLQQNVSEREQQIQQLTNELQAAKEDMQGTLREKNAQLEQTELALEELKLSSQDLLAQKHAMLENLKNLEDTKESLLKRMQVLVEEVGRVEAVQREQENNTEKMQRTCGAQSEVNRMATSKQMEREAFLNRWQDELTVRSKEVKAGMESLHEKVSSYNERVHALNKSTKGFKAKRAAFKARTECEKHLALRDVHEEKDDSSSQELAAKQVELQALMKQLSDKERGLALESNRLSSLDSQLQEKDKQICEKECLVLEGEKAVVQSRMDIAQKVAAYNERVRSLNKATKELKVKRQAFRRKALASAASVAVPLLEVDDSDAQLSKTVDAGDRGGHKGSSSSTLQFR